MHMKKSLDGKVVKRSSAMNCLLVNQFATPGLGSLMGRRFLAGAVQIILAFAGFLLVIVWFIQILVKTYRDAAELPPLAMQFAWTGKVGAILFIAAWLLAWITSIDMLRQARASSNKNAAAFLPPKLDKN
jgi:hypothetical protein